MPKKEGHITLFHKNLQITKNFEICVTNLPSGVCNHQFLQPIPKWKRRVRLSLKAYSNRKGPNGESTRIPAPYPNPLPGFPRTPAGSPEACTNDDYFDDQRHLANWISVGTGFKSSYNLALLSLRSFHSYKSFPLWGKAPYCQHLQRSTF